MCVCIIYIYTHAYLYDSLWEQIALTGKLMMVHAFALLDNSLLTRLRG